MALEDCAGAIGNGKEIALSGKTCAAVNDCGTNRVCVREVRNATRGNNYRQRVAPQSPTSTWELPHLSPSDQAKPC